MKKITLFMAILFTSLTYSQVTIGTGNDGGVLESPPLTSYYGFSYGQSIYLSSEINANGNITSVAFQLIAGADMSKADNMVDVWIGHTTKTSFTSTSDWVDVASLTQVLTNGTVTIASDILTIMFSTPFAYNGTDNLIIAVDANESGYGSSGDRISVTDGPTINLSIMYRSDSTNPDPTSLPTSNVRRFQSRGNITFNGIAQSCPNPSTLTVTNITTTSANLGWTAGGMETMWNIEWGTAGFTQGMGTTATANTNSHALTTLTANTGYEFYVQANCGAGSSSAWIGPFAFKTQCLAVPTPYTQNFDTFTVASSAFTNQNCWSGTNIGSYLWEVAATTDTSSSNTGPGSGVSNGNYLFTESSGGASADAINLVSPQIDLSNLTNPSLSFDYHMFGANMGSLEVIVTQGGTSTSLITLTGQQQAAETDSFLTKTVNLSAYANQTIQITFKGIRGAGFTSDIAIDTIIVEELPTCINPTPVSTSNITTTSADISWTAVSGSTGYNYEYGISPYAQGGGGTSVSTTSNMVSLTNLTNTKTYDFYVQNNCGSTYVKVTFSTPAPPPANDDCANAIALTVNNNISCSNTTSGTTAGATASPQPDNATGTPNNDVWFTFVATATDHHVSLLNIVAVVGTSTDLAMSVFNDVAGCNMVAANEVGESDPNTLNLNGLTTGNTYYVRVYGWASTSTAQASFDICINLTPPTPANDNCANAIALTVNNNSSCSNTTSGTTAGATASPQPDNATGTPNNDVWFTFVATATDHHVSLLNIVAVVGTSTDLAMSVFNDVAGCNMVAANEVGESDPNTLNLNGLTTGNTYYVRVYGWASTSTAQASFDICINLPPPPPANDDCANAVAITPGSVFGTNPVDGTVTSATLGSESNDCGSNGPGVWYSVLVPADGNITIETGVDAATGNTGFDSVIEAFSGTCGALTSIDCDDDGAAGNFFSLLNLTGLTAGSTIYIRVWESGGNQDEPFSISAYNATLSVSSNGIEGFSMFPSPVTNILKFIALDTIETISVFSLLGQEVIRTFPNTLETELSMTHLQTGVYIVKVKVGEQIGTYKVLKD